jgi:hypothetical protein
MASNNATQLVQFYNLTLMLPKGKSPLRLFRLMNTTTNPEFRITSFESLRERTCNGGKTSEQMVSMKWKGNSNISFLNSES